MPLSLNSARALVTGAASGLGHAVATHIIRKGGRVALLDNNEPLAREAADGLGDRAFFVHCDVSSSRDVAGATAEVDGRLGEITLLVNCAGIDSAQRVVGPESLLPDEVFRRIIDINLTGTFLMIRAVAQRMQHNAPQSEDGERGVIVNTASVAAYEGQIGQVPYAASKGAVAAMTLPLAREFAAFGVRVMTIAPGIFNTPLYSAIPQAQRQGLLANVPFPQRAGQAGEFAALVAHLYENPMFNGEVIRLDGALRMPAKNRPLS